MAKRKIIKINASKCNGCGLCLPNCPEGAIRLIDGKARLISDLFCDGLGACLGHCPQGAITIEERQAQKYDEKKVMENIVKQGSNVLRAHLVHLKEHAQDKYFKEALDYLKEKNILNPLKEESLVADSLKPRFSGCPSAKMMDLRREENSSLKGPAKAKGQKSQLQTWPVQLMLVPAHAPYLNNANLLIAADCVPFAYADFHQDLLKGKVLLVGCPKLDNLEVYQEKIRQLLKNYQIKSITYAHMEVPCCFGLLGLIKEAISASGKDTPFQEEVISITGEKLNVQ